MFLRSEKIHKGHEEIEETVKTFILYSEDPMSSDSLFTDTYNSDPSATVIVKPINPTFGNTRSSTI